MHWPGRDNANPRPFLAQSKGDMQEPLLKRLAQRVPTRLLLAMVPIFYDQQRLTEKHLLGLKWRTPCLSALLRALPESQSKPTTFFQSII